jgi:hypothetical protein
MARRVIQANRTDQNDLMIEQCVGVAKIANYDAEGIDAEFDKPYDWRALVIGVTQIES